MSTITLKDKAYTYIKEKLINCEYMPGEILVESEIVKAVNASRTPIREALNKLEQEKLIRIVPKRGVFVEEISISTVQDVFEMRQLIEPYLVKTVGAEIPLAALKELEQEVILLEKENNPEPHYVFDNKLHHTILEYSQNQYILSLMQGVYDQNMRIRILTGKDSVARLHNSQKEHAAIIQAILDKDFLLAAEYMETHLEISKTIAFDSITNQRGFSVTF